jgi:hypothetical protein
MRNIRMEDNIKRGNCANCGARLAIIKKPIGSKK